MKSGFKRTINLNKYQLKVTLQALNPNLDYVIEPSFQEVNRLFGLSFENSTDVEIKNYYVMIDGQSFFDQPVKNDLKTYDNIQKIVTGQGDD